MQYGHKILTNGLVFYVNAADKASFSGPGSNNWKDISSSNISGTNCLVGGPTFSSANGGYITTGINTSGKYFTWGANISQVNFQSNNFTISLMLKPYNDFVGGAQLGIMGYGQEGQSGYWMMISKYAYQSIDFMTGQFGTFQRTSSSIFTSYANKWVYLTIVRTGSSVKIYANDVDITQTAGTHSNPTSNTTIPLLLGACTIPGGTSWSGYADYASFAMYNRALSASELTQNFNAVRSRFGI
jgi:hypothetical protein